MFETQRLIVRPLETADREAYLRLFSDPEAMRHYAVGRPLEEEEAEERFRFFLAHQRVEGFSLGAVVLRDTGEMIGFGGVAWSWWSPERELFLSFLFAPRVWGRGLATELARGGVSFAFDVLDEWRMTATVHPDNGASARVLEKAGFIRMAFDCSDKRWIYEVRRDESSDADLNHRIHSG